MKIPIVPGDDHLKLIGEVMVNFDVLEEILSSLTWLLMNINGDIAGIVTAELSFARKLALTSSLYRYRADEKTPVGRAMSRDFEEFNKLMLGCQKAGEKRNMVAHSFWVKGSSPELAKRYKTTAKGKQGVKSYSEEWTTDKLRETADSIAEVAAHLLHFENQYKDSL